MQTSVNLQEPFSYSIYYIMILLILVLIITIYYILNKKEKEVKPIVKIKNIDINDKNTIKQKYMQELDKLEKDVKENKISQRLAYQNLSSIIRLFIYEMTDIKLQNYTLRDIKSLNMPEVYELIKEYYVPEFARRYLGDIKTSMDKTRKVIEKWN